MTVHTKSLAGKNNRSSWISLSFLIMLSALLLPMPVKADATYPTTLEEQKADAAKFLTPEVQKQMAAIKLPPDDSNDNIPANYYYDQTEPEVPWPTVVANKTFAQQYGLDMTKAVDLGPSIQAMTLMYKSHFKLNYSPSDPFIQKYHLDKLTAGEKDILNQHLQVLPHLFKKEKMPLILTYDCYIGVYFNTADPAVSNIMHPDFQFWLADMVPVIEQTAIEPIDEFRPANADPATSFKSQFEKSFNPNLPTALVTQTGQSNYTSLSNYGYFANLVPGITYYVFKGTCADLAHTFESGSTQLWLEKSTSKNHVLYQSSKSPKFSADDFYQFNIPADIIQSKTLASIVQHDKRAIKEGYYDFDNVVDDVNRPKNNH